MTGATQDEQAIGLSNRRYEVTSWSHSGNGADFVQLCNDIQARPARKQPRRKHSLHATEIALDDIMFDAPKHSQASTHAAFSSTSSALSNCTFDEQPRLPRAASTPLPEPTPTCVLGYPVDISLAADSKLSMSFNHSMHNNPAALLDSAVVPPRQSSGQPRATLGKPASKITLRARLLHVLHLR